MEKADEHIKAWVTKYALTDGIQLVEGTLSRHSRTVGLHYGPHGFAGINDLNIEIIFTLTTRPVSANSKTAASPKMYAPSDAKHISTEMHQFALEIDQKLPSAPSEVS